MRARIVFVLLLVLKSVSRLLYRFEWHWVGERPAGRRWQPYRLVAILNHTSLFEVLLAGGPPNHFLWRLARRGVVPVAKKTMTRPFIGKLFSLIAANVVPISRSRDDSWQRVLASIDDDSMVVILPEGRMKRADGKDLEGKPMTLRTGIADLIDVIGTGTMLIAYSEGLHHVQVPDQGLPRLFQTLRLRLETIDIASFRTRLKATTEHQAHPNAAFRKAVVDDLTARRDRYCRQDFDPSGALAEFHRGQRTPGS